MSSVTTTEIDTYRDPLPPDVRYFEPEEFSGMMLWVRLAFEDSTTGRFHVLAKEISTIAGMEDRDYRWADDVPHIESWLQHHCNYPYTLTETVSGTAFTMDVRDGVIFRMHFGGEETPEQFTKRTGRRG